MSGLPFDQLWAELWGVENDMVVGPSVVLCVCSYCMTADTELGSNADAATSRFVSRFLKWLKCMFVK